MANYRHSEDELITNLKQFAESLGRTPTSTEMEADGPHSSTTYQNRFGSWNNAIQEAGLERTRVQDQVEVECIYCGTPFTKKYSHAQDHSQHFCDEECMGAWESKHYSGEGNPRFNSETVECHYCGSKLQRAEWQLETRKRHFCDGDCRGKWFSETGFVAGENSPRWKGGPAKYGKGWSEEKREAVRERDDRECQVCGLTEDAHLEEFNRKLSVHHIIPARQFDNPEERNSEDNLLSLCLPCHRKWEGIPLRPQSAD